MVSVRMGKYGPLAQMTDPQDAEAKPRFANIPDGLFLNNITLEQALPLFAWPKALGSYEELPVSVGKGKFGPFVRHGQSYISLPKDADLWAISLEQAIEFILAKRKKDAEKIIHHFEADGIQVLNGQWGPYLTYDGRIYKIPKSTDAKLLTYDECKVLIKEGEATSKPLKGAAKKPKPSAVRKKASPRKKTA
jgi:DNA topoisomerase-1